VSRNRSAFGRSASRSRSGTFPTGVALDIEFGRLALRLDIVDLLGLTKPA
jgi:hypothetical protein